MRARFLAGGALLAWLATGLGCAHAFNYRDPGGSGCALAAAPQPATDAAPGSFEVVSFNIKFGRDPEGALRTLQAGASRDEGVCIPAS